jgi:type IV secretion system protein VirB8
MMFKRKATSGDAPADHADSSVAKDPTAVQMGKWYLNQAMLFEKSKQDSQKRITQLALRGAAGALVVAAVSIVGSSALVLLKRPNPPAVLRVNTANGVTDVLEIAPDSQMTYTEQQARADLRRYVEMRESYDWETIQDLYDTVKLMSADQERDVCMKLFSLPNAPQKVLKDQYRIVAHVGAITFVGSTAQVFFSKKLIPLGSGQQAAKVAAEAGLYVEFADDTLNQVMQVRRAELVAERANAVSARSRSEPHPVAAEPKVTPVSPVTPAPAVANPPMEPKR